MAIATAQRERLIAGLQCHEEKRNELAAMLRLTPASWRRHELLVAHTEACRCVAAFQAELAKG